MPPAHHTDAGTLVESAGRRRAILLAVCTALIAVVASASGLNVAQHDLALDLGASQSEVLWVINSYVVTLAALLLPMGAIADRRGRKPVLLAGLVVFGAANAAAGFAGGVEALLVARVAAGVGAAMVMPVTLSVITSSFPPATRSQAIGVWSAVAGGGGLLGMLSSALLVDLASWRWLFALPVALVAAALALTLATVPNSRERTAARFDLVGSLLSIAGIGGLVLGIHEGPTRGWTAAATLVPLAGGAAALAGFVAWELRLAGAPLLDLRAFRDRRLASGSTALLVMFGVSAGVFVVLFPFFETVLGWSALRSMLGLLPLIVVMMGASGAAAGVARRLGAATTMTAGVGVAAAGLALMAALVSVDGGYLSVLPGMVAIGLGMGLTMPPATEAITAALPPESQGVASALNDTTREVGSAIGIALLGAVLTASYRHAIEPALAAFPDRLASAAGEGVGRALDAAAHSTDPGRADRLLDAARAAFVEGWAASMWAASAATAALFLVLAVRTRGNWTRTAP
ncbi:MFS transporter [Conexibacter sp. JD483]|uniref:MFS transporter n=1 Tax=unclassified Conexibacter TaxID=2627773 RepID=UPI00271C650E|nr:MULTISPECIES: MFS transporter [unclassified Conexibacter]MDO8189238.1 MFS transporter [Conexibacter sp. CPCC 205706]MDO8198724.1 MFS transporter [Conexibacter sp. CPCC 205762]MDR9372111.1 MFS transporter [Conexibacter sp. JD483]